MFIGLVVSTVMTVLPVTALSDSGPPSEGLVVSLSVPKAQYRTSDEIAVTVTVLNVSQSTLAPTLPQHPNVKTRACA